MSDPYQYFEAKTSPDDTGLNGPWEDFRNCIIYPVSLILLEIAFAGGWLIVDKLILGN